MLQVSVIEMNLKITKFKIIPVFPRANELNRKS